MKNYREDILIRLIDHYEGTKFYKGQSSKKPNCSLNLNKEYPKYGNSECFKETNEIEKAIDYLLKRDFIKPGKWFEYRKREVLLNTEEDILENIYQELHRTPEKEVRKQFISDIQEIHSVDFVNNFLVHIVKKTQNYESISKYVSKMDISEVKDIVDLLEHLYQQKTEIMLRKFSQSVIHDTKKFNVYKTRILHVVQDFYNPFIENENQMLECFNILKNPTCIHIKGDMEFKIHDQRIDLKKVDHEFVFTKNHLESLEILNVHNKRIMTVENLTSYYSVEPKDTLVIYLGGYHNRQERKFLLQLYDFLKDSVVYDHFGDIDAGGFYIYFDLINKTNMPFHTYKMDVETLKEYQEYAKPLTNRDIHNLKLLNQQYHLSVIQYMLDHKIKLEQEIIDVV